MAWILRYTLINAHGLVDGRSSLKTAKSQLTPVRRGVPVGSLKPSNHCWTLSPRHALAWRGGSAAAIRACWPPPPSRPRAGGRSAAAARGSAGAGRECALHLKCFEGHRRRVMVQPRQLTAVRTSEPAIIGRHPFPRHHDWPRACAMCRTGQPSPCGSCGSAPARCASGWQPRSNSTLRVRNREGSGC